MAQESNTEILNKILEDLDTIIKEQTNSKDSKKVGNSKNINLKIDGHEDVVALLVGIGALKGKQKRNFKETSNAIKELAMGLKDFEDVKINKDAIKNLEPLLNFMTSITALSDTKAIKQGIKSFKKIFSLSMAIRLRMFMWQMSKIKGGKKFEDASKLITAVTKLIMDLGSVKAYAKVIIGIKALKKIASIDKEIPKGLSKFVMALLSPLPRKKKHLKYAERQLKFLKDALVIIGELPVIKLFFLNILGEKLKPEYGKSVGQFIAAIIAPLQAIEKDELETAQNVVNAITKLLSSIVIAIAVLTALVMIDLKSTLIGTTLILGIIAVLVGLSKWIGSEKKEIKSGAKGMADLGKAVMYITIAIGLMSLLVTLFDLKTLLISTITVLSIMALLILMSKMAGGKEEKHIATGIKGLLWLSMALVIVVGAIGLMALLFTKFKVSDILLGTLVVIGIMAALVGLTYLLSKIEDKELKHAEIALGVVAAILLAVTLITTLLIIPIGKEIKPAALGSLVVVGILALLVLAVYALSEIDAKTALKGLGIVLGLGLIMLGICFIVTELIIPIGERAKEALYGSGIVLGLIVGMGLILAAAVALGKAVKTSDLIKGALIIVGIGGILWVLAELLPNYLDLIDKVNEKGFGYIQAGNGSIMLLMAEWGALMAAIGALSSVVGYIAMGGVALAAIAGVLWVVSQTLDPFIALIEKVNEVGFGKMQAGNGSIMLLMGEWGLLMTAIGALAPIIPLIVMGGVALASIGAVLWSLSKTMAPFIDLCEKVRTAKDLDKSSDKILGLVEKFGLVVAGIGALTLIPFFSIGLGAGVGYMLGIATAMAAVNKAMGAFLSSINYFKKIKPAERDKFIKYMTDTDNGFCGAITRIVEGLENIGLWSSIKAAIIATMLKPIFSTINDFLRVVQNFGQLKIVSEWDKDGKPIKYEKMTPSMFRRAANAISSSFAIFLSLLGKAMKDWNWHKAFILKMLAETLQPVMQSVGTFVDAICKFIAWNIADEWDEQGNPTHFKSINPDDFANAADKIAVSFTSFLITLGNRLKDMPLMGIMAMDAIKDGIEPVMNAVGVYTKAIQELITGTVVETDVLDANGNPTGETIKKLIEFNPDDFANAAVILSDALTGFLETLINSFSKYDYQEVSSAEVLGMTVASKTTSNNKMVEFMEKMKGMKEIMDIVKNIADYLLKNATDIVNKGSDMKTSASTLAKIIVNMVEPIVDSMEDIAIDAATGKFKKNFPQIRKVIIETYNQFIKMYKKAPEIFGTMQSTVIGFLQEICSDTNIAVYKRTQSTINDYLSPLIKNISNLYQFFSTLSLKESSGFSLSGIFGGDKIDLKAAKSHVAQLKLIMQEFSDTLELYNNAPTAIGLDIINKLGNAIVVMYKNADSQFKIYKGSFNKVSTQYTTHITKTLIPTINSLIRVSISLYNITNKLDKQLINQEAKRTKALKKLTESIEEVNNVTAKLAENLKQSEENAKNAFKAAQDLAATKQENAIVSANETITANQQANDKMAKLLNKDSKDDDKNMTPEEKRMKKLIDQLAVTVSMAVANAMLQTFNGKNLNIQFPEQADLKGILRF